MPILLMLAVAGGFISLECSIFWGPILLLLGGKPSLFGTIWPLFWSGFIWLLSLGYLLPPDQGSVPGPASGCATYYWHSIAIYLVITGNRGWSYWVLCQRGVLLVHLRSCLKWTIHIFSGAPVWGDSKSSGPMFVPFLIRWENTKYPWKADGGQFDLLRFGWFNLYLDPFFKEILNLKTEISDLACSICNTQNSDWGTRRGSGHIHRLGWFNLYPDLFFEENLDLKRES